MCYYRINLTELSRERSEWGQSYHKWNPCVSVQSKVNKLRTSLTICEENYSGWLPGFLEFSLDSLQESKVLIWVSREAITSTCMGIDEPLAPSSMAIVQYQRTM